MSQADLPRELSNDLGQAVDPSVIATPQLHRLLHAATQRGRTAKLLSLALGGFATLLGAMLAGVALDAMWGLPSWGLVVIDLVLIAIGVGLVVMLWRTARSARHDARHAAVAMEQHGGVEPSRLINALDLSASHGPTADQMSPTLRRIAVEQGDNAAARLDPAALIDRPARRRAFVSFVGVFGVCVGAWLSLPGVFGAVGPRLLNPWSGLPAYTTLRFDVAIGAGSSGGLASGGIHVGKPGVVEVTLSRTWGNQALPSEADVVVIGTDGADASGGDAGSDAGGSSGGVSGGGEVRVLPMHRSFRESEAWPAAVDAGNDPNAELPAPAPPTRFSLRFERIDAPVTFYIDTPGGRSATYTITPDTTPLFESLHMTVTPPDYTGWSPTTQRLQVDEAGAKENIVRALRGSAVTLTASSNVPVAEAQLLMSATSRPSVFPGSGDDTTAEALFIVDASSAAQLQLVGEDDARSALMPITIEALGDAPPTVSIHSPEPLAYAVEGYPVPIRIVAKDDVGVASLKLHLSVADQDIAPIELTPAPASGTISPPTTPPFERRVAATYELDLVALGTQAGDTVRYFAAARDHLPFALGGPPNDLGQSAETAVQEIQIISQAEWEALARLQYGLEQMRAEAEKFMAEMDQLAQDRAAIIEQLATLQQKLESGEALNDMERQQMQDLQDQLDAFAQEAQALAQAMRERAEVPALYEFEEPFKERLEELAERLEQQADLAQAMSEATEPMAGTESGDEKNESSSPRIPGVTPTQIEEFLEQAQRLSEADEPFDEQTQEEMDEFEEDLLRLELAQEMLFHAERIREVIVQQRELEKKLGALRFRQPDELTPDEAQRLAAYGEQAFELRDELEDAALMLRESAELAGPLLPNMSGTSVMLTEKLDRLEVYPDMERVGERAEDADAGLAHAAAQLAADKLETLLSDASSMPSQAESDFGNDPPMSLPKASQQKAMQQMSDARAAGAMMRQMQAGPGQAGRSGGTAGGTNASLIGPRPMGGNASNAGDGREATGESTPANAAAGLVPEVGDAQTLNPESTDSRGRAAIALPGVPARYQDVAAAYFQRLADEATRDGQD